MIEPTVGRVVWVRQRKESDNQSQPETGQITFVHGDREVNIVGFNSRGYHFCGERVTLVQEGDEKPAGMYVEWMPYQKGQAAKTEALERQLPATSGEAMQRAQERLASGGGST